MRDTLADVLKQTIGLFETIKITGTADRTRLQAFDPKTKNVFVDANLKDPAPDLEGEFGISNLSLLRGLLDFPAYRGEKASFGVKRRDFGASQGGATVEAFEFSDGRGAGATYRCMSPKTVPIQAEITKVNWNVSITPDKAKLTEFTQMASLYAEVDKNFGVKTVNGNLLASFGKDNSSTHKGSMVFVEGVSGSFPGGLQWSAAQFLSTLKIAGSDAKVYFSDRGLLMVENETDQAFYKYYLRAIR